MLLSLCCLHLAAPGRFRRMHSRDRARVRFNDFSDLDQLLEPPKVVGELSFGDGGKDLGDFSTERSASRFDLRSELDFCSIAGDRPESNPAGVMDIGAVE